MQYVDEENAMQCNARLVSSHLLVPLDALDLDLDLDCLVLRSELSLPGKMLVYIEAKGYQHNSLALV